MWVALIAIGLLGFLGHLMFWISVFRKVHATGMPHKLSKAFEQTIYPIVAIVPFAQIWLVAITDFTHQTLEWFFTHNFLVTIYLALCIATLVVGVPSWLRQR